MVLITAGSGAVPNVILALLILDANVDSITDQESVGETEFEETAASSEVLVVGGTSVRVDMGKVSMSSWFSKCM